ncbi:hypothetical protein [Virgibacillus proomii]|uniref:hypothetical protein n=1 Tax=Virgibacillus proomii TaxID=84407 RepID=UPI001C1258BC|nr:hypothetical protein [Virgibacillus proomii]MBU5265368.1 hypothetical protein [Virgibacillus proomii]
MDKPATAGVRIQFSIFHNKKERNEGNTPIKIIPKIDAVVRLETSNGEVIKKGMLAVPPKNAVIVIIVIGEYYLLFFQ